MEKYLHICIDGNFISNAMNIFEHYYKEQNVYVMFNFRDKREYPKNVPLYRFNKDDKSAIMKINEILCDNKIDEVVIHGMDYCFIPLLKFIKQYNSKITINWIYWGYELYSALGEKGLYKLQDAKSFFSVLTLFTPSRLNAVLRFCMGRKSRYKTLVEGIKYVDFFCFWMYSEYELFQKYFQTPIKYKYFQYISSFKRELTKREYCLLPKEKYSVMINHQATLTGNYETILEKLHKIDVNSQYKYYIPLSYGSNYVKKQVIRKGKKSLKNMIPIMEYMPIDKYVSFLSRIEVAIFGQKRQEAAGNIIELLKNGTKVFLREGNPLLTYYREKGYLVFSFENELNTIEDLKPLTAEQQLYNMQQVDKVRCCYDDFMPRFFK